ncbi:MAG: S-layer homology domain-containing protein [Cyanobacteria bacterium P01_A01_bin.135]
MSTRLQSTTALMLLLGSASAPLISPAPAAAQTRFSDIPSGYWAEQFIGDLAARDVIAGFPDGSFQPNAPVTRAQYAAMVRKAFNQADIRRPVAFVDVAGNYWATPAINDAYSMGFLSGYPGNVFRPDQNIPRAQVLVSLANGLGYSANSSSGLRFYNDAAAIPDYATGSIAAATEEGIVVNYPSVNRLRPNETATRADVAAFIYQALASQGQVTAVSSPYIVNVAQTPSTPSRSASLPAGATIPVTYDDNDEIVLLPEETVPLTLRVSRTLTNNQGQVVVPVDSEVVGELRPAEGGTRFVAQELVLTNGQRIAINATSQIVTETKTIGKGIDILDTIGGAAAGSAAAAVIAEVTGDSRIDVLEVLAGTAAGTIGGVLLGGDRVEVITVDPTADLNLTLNSNLVL